MEPTTDKEACKCAAMQAVILSQVLACEATLGYEDYSNLHVIKFNGQPVRNLEHLARMVFDCKDKYMRFDLDYQVRKMLPVVAWPT